MDKVSIVIGQMVRHRQSVATADHIMCAGGLISADKLVGWVLIPS